MALMNTPKSASKKTTKACGPARAVKKPRSHHVDAKVIGKFRCPTCQCVHYGISKEDALAVVRKMNAYLETVSELELREWYGGKGISIERFKRCFYCGTLSTAFLQLDEESEDCSASHQAVIAPSFNQGEAK